MGGHITIRQVTSMDRKLEVRERMKRRYAFKNYPDEFNFRCKCIVVFQNLDGVDVILFGLYVYEHDEDNPEPNKRTVYVSYLDSVHYMRPRKMRTFIYHEILIAYLDYVRARGFSTAHIWACPPLKGDDYILYAKPEDQKVPRDDRLRQWYIDMLIECQRRGVVGTVTNMYDLYFSNPKNDATIVPYMDGDYFPAEVENIIKDIEDGKTGKKGSSQGKKKKGNNQAKQKKKKSGRGGTRSTGLDEDALKKSGILGSENLPIEEGGRDYVMQKLGETIQPMKESFIVAFLAWEGAKPENMVVPKEIAEYRKQHGIVTTCGTPAAPATFSIVEVTDGGGAGEDQSKANDTQPKEQEPAQKNEAYKVNLSSDDRGKTMDNLVKAEDNTAVSASDPSTNSVSGEQGKPAKEGNDESKPDDAKENGGKEESKDAVMADAPAPNVKDEPKDDTKDEAMPDAAPKVKEEEKEEPKDESMQDAKPEESKDADKKAADDSTTSDPKPAENKDPEVKPAEETTTTTPDDGAKDETKAPEAKPEEESKNATVDESKTSPDAAPSPAPAAETQKPSAENENKAADPSSAPAPPTTAPSAQAPTPAAGPTDSVPSGAPAPASSQPPAPAESASAPAPGSTTGPSPTPGAQPADAQPVMAIRLGKFAAMAKKKRDVTGELKEPEAEEKDKAATDATKEKKKKERPSRATTTKDSQGRIVKVIDDDDEEMDCEFLNNRQAFLNLCQGNHYQFDHLRRAKHSSMMVLWHLHNRDAPKFVQQCATCSREILQGYRYHCPTCADFDQCQECVHNPKVAKHPHPLKPIPVASGQQPELTEEQRKERQRSIQLHMTLLQHAATCNSAKCPSANCTKMKGLLKHGAQCQIKATGGCNVCKRIWALLQIHARQCKASSCPVPNCMAIRERVRQLKKQQQAMDDRRRQEMNRAYARNF